MILIISALLFFVWGICQGMVMVNFTDKNCDIDLIDHEWGIRCHKWFKKYHLLDALVIVLALYLGYIFPHSNLNCFFVMVLLVMGWELKEIGYSIARYLKIIPTQENVEFFDIFSIRLLGKNVIILHIIRIAVFIILLIGGLIW